MVFVSSDLLFPSEGSFLSRSLSCFPLSGIILRSSVWLGLPNISEQISDTNSTDVWPEVYCVGSAVRTTPPDRVSPRSDFKASCLQNILQNVSSVAKRAMDFIDAWSCTPSAAESRER